MITTEYLLLQMDRYIQFTFKSDSGFQGLTHILEILTFSFKGKLHDI